MTLSARRLPSLCIVLLLWFAGGASAAQDAPAAPTTASTPSATVDATPAAVPTIPPTAAATSPAATTPAADVPEDPQVLELRTSGYYELVDRARKLGLDDTGGVPELKKRIADKLGLTLPADDKNTTGKTLTIDTAQQAGVMTIDSPPGGKLVHLSGDLQVTLVDNEKKVTHIIEAGELWYDQESGEMTARGNVVYTMIRESSREVFRGDSLTFRMSDSEGVFYGGSSDRNRTIGSKTLVFRYQGDAIRRAASDVVVLDSGSITSSLGQDPYYHLQAKKIWVLRPGEWGLQDAVLYIGRIPVFWFPFFFQPGDDFFFNPVLSFSDTQNRRGTILQTTTYLWGKKTRETSPLSFLQVEDSTTKDEDKVIRGLFLTRGKPPESQIPTGWTLKFLADFYSHLGFLGGVDANLPDLGPFKTFKTTLGIGITRNVSADGQTFQINPFDALLSQDAQSHWNGSWLGSLRLPFRWGGTLELGDSNWNLTAEYSSDPLFYGDLTSGRSENFSMFSLLGLEPVKKTAVGAVKNNLQWKGNLNLPQGSLSASLLWDVKKTTEALATTDPELNFYIPTQLLAPSLTFQWSGDLFKAPVSNPGAGTPTGKLPDLLSPDADPNPDAADGAAKPADQPPPPLPDLTSPDLMTSLAEPPAPPVWANSLNWSLAPSLRVDSRFDNTQVLQASDARGTILSSRWNGAWDGKLGYTGSFSDGGLSLTENTSMHQQMQQAWFLEDTLPSAVRDTYKLQDEQQTNSLLLQTLNSTWKPLISLTPFKDSSLSYSLSSKLWENKSGTNTFFDATTATVPTHQLVAQGYWQIWDSAPSVKVGSSWQNSLPPLAPNLVWGNSLDVQDTLWKLSTKASWKNLAADWNNLGSDWKPDPWESTLELTPIQGLSLQENFQFDLVNERPQSSSTKFSFAGLVAQYRQQQTAQYVFDKTQKKWVATGVTGFLPQEANISYSLSVPLYQSWENRQSASGNFSFSWPINLQQYSQMPLTMNYSFQYKLYRFLDVQISEGIINRAAYRYFPALVDSFGTGAVKSVNFFTDLADSLSFWDDAARRRGGFKMTTLSVGLIHYLDDWQIKLDYSGSPQLTGTVKPQFQWAGTLSLLVQWYPVPELKTQVQWDREGKLSIPKNSP